MISRTTERFRRALTGLPPRIQAQARVAFRQFQENPHHPGLRLKQVHSSKPIYSVRISRDYRALASQTDEVMVWFWIGTHADYSDLVSRL